MRVRGFVLIFGRSPNLVLALLSAAFNILVSFEVGGFVPTPEQVAQVNVFLFALVAFIANSDTIVIAAGNAARTRALKVSGKRTTDPVVTCADCPHVDSSYHDAG